MPFHQNLTFCKASYLYKSLLHDSFRPSPPFLLPGLCEESGGVFRKGVAGGRPPWADRLLRLRRESWFPSSL